MRIEGGLHDVADLTPLKPGKYDLVIKTPMEVKLDPNEKTDIGTKLYTFIVWPEAISGEYAGKKVRRQFSNKSKTTRYFLKQFLTAIGVTIGTDGSFSSESLLGKRFSAEVTSRSYKDKNTGEDKTASDIDERSIKILT